ncbi:MAG: hypothetical protein R3311_06050 [Oceanisphaera sp.]|nr:hypothetical protein [Oceanisphaera sp.]
MKESARKESWPKSGEGRRYRLGHGLRGENRKTMNQPSRRKPCYDCDHENLKFQFGSTLDESSPLSPQLNGCRHFVATWDNY